MRSLETPLAVASPGRCGGWLQRASRRNSPSLCLRCASWHWSGISIPTLLQDCFNCLDLKRKRVPLRFFTTSFRRAV
jgi:hypothetical protein